MAEEVGVVNREEFIRRRREMTTATACTMTAWYAASAYTTSAVKHSYPTSAAPPAERFEKKTAQKAPAPKRSERSILVDLAFVLVFLALVAYGYFYGN